MRIVCDNRVSKEAGNPRRKDGKGNDEGIQKIPGR